MKRSTLFHTIILVLCAARLLTAQTTQNPILFVTQVPTPADSLTVLSAFGGHLAGPANAPRGGDLWIRYQDGTTKNLTQAAGYGMAGLQGANAIAVREPSMHWSGLKAIFSMVVGAPTAQGDPTQYYWQLYEITGLGKSETPVITKVANQPATFNNLTPIYGTDERIIFTSDRPRSGEQHLYPQFDEYKLEPTIAGLYSLDPGTGDLFLLDHSPSGDFAPIIDSYGRLIFIRWDHLQRDGVADRDVLGQTHRGTFNYADETANAAQLFGDRTEYFPEPQAARTDLLAGTNVIGMEFNIFLPWQINEDGTEEETMNHVGRHELRQTFGRNINNDPQVVNFDAAASGRANTNSIVNLMQIAEDPNNPGIYYCIDAPQTGSHGGGQVLTIKGQTTLDPNQMGITYITDRSTSNIVFPGQPTPPNHTGLYRNPLPTSDGKLIVAHSPETRADSNTGTPTSPLSRYTFRVKTLKKSGPFWVPDQLLTTGISKSVSYWNPNVMITYNGPLWELYPVEVRARTKPQRRASSLETQEQQVFAEEGVNETIFRNYLKSRDLAVVISRNVTYRDKADHQQPFYLRVAGTATQSANATGKVYNVQHMDFFQADQLRGFGKTSPTATPVPGRRVLPQPMHDPNVQNPPDPTGNASTVKLGTDGSMAAMVPARRAMSWLLSDSTGAPVVRERYWVTFQPGELRTCTSCHGTNSSAAAPINSVPQNKPEALRDLLRYWKQLVLPAAATLRSPANDSINVPTSGTLAWDATAGAVSYRVQLGRTADFAALLLDSNSATETSLNFNGLAPGITYYWRVQAANSYGAGAWSDAWSFTTYAPVQPPQQAVLISPANTTTGVTVANKLVWHAIPAAATYHVQLSTKPDFSTFTANAANLADTSNAFEGLTKGTVYYWRVQGVNTGGSGSWSAVWSFTTETEVVVVNPPPAIGLISPANGATKVASGPALTWSAVASAVSYRAQVSTAADFTAPVADTALPQLMLQLSGLAENTTYFWRVQGVNTGGTGAWSEVWRFTTVPPISTTSVGMAGVAGYAFQAFPNPAQGRAYLRITLPQAGYASIRVYDLLGKEIATVTDSYLEAGERIYTYEPPVAGTYLCRAQSGAYTGTSIVQIVR